MPIPTPASPTNPEIKSEPETGTADFPIVGIGCSAGGLEALEAFFSHTPCDTGMAFIIIQHLDPSHLSSLPQLLQRITPMPVVEAADRMPVHPDCVYVIPPNKDLSLLHGVLHLLEPTERRGLRLPIDFFLQTLADDQRENAIGVILSGMGSDGVHGLAAIKAKSGLTLAQEPTSAQADSMPKSVIKAGIVDIVALPAVLPECILNFSRHIPDASLSQEIPKIDQQSTLEKIIILLRNRTGNDFSLYKPSTLYRRIERRTTLLQLENIGKYVPYLRDHPQELDLLFKELLIGVTNFFRDPALWEFLREIALPSLFTKYPNGKQLRAWVPACSSGEEAFSLAIVFREAIERIKPKGHFTLQIYATDLDADAIDKARRAVYPRNITVNVSPERLAHYFSAEDDGYRVNKDIREMVIFAPQNIISDPPFTKLDLISCRNLLIYFGAELQKKLLPMFQYALNRDGILVLGSAETVGDFTELFSPMDKKNRVFARLDQPSQPYRLDFPISHPTKTLLPYEGTRPEFRDTLEYLTDQVIQQHFSPAAVLVNGDGDILYFSGRTGKYLEPAAGKVNINIHAMAREGLRDALTGVIRTALHQTEPIHLNGLRIGNHSNALTINVTVQGIEKPDALRNRVLVVFNDVTAPTGSRKSAKSAASDRESALTLELQQTRGALRSIHEEMQTSDEEAKSANEEIQASNEELTTSKEELQSMNEELQTVNAELQSKLDDLSWARNDMSNLLNSTEIATVFLDNQMNLRRFTPYATHLFKLIPGDVGRSLSDIVTDLNYPKLKEDALEVLASLVFHEQQVSTQDGRWYRVRIMPYRTQDNVIDGVVITFIDITAIKQLEAKLRQREVVNQDVSTNP